MINILKLEDLKIFDMETILTSVFKYNTKQYEVLQYDYKQGKAYRIDYIKNGTCTYEQKLFLPMSQCLELGYKNYILVPRWLIIKNNISNIRGYINS